MPSVDTEFKFPSHSSSCHVQRHPFLPPLAVTLSPPRPPVTEAHHVAHFPYLQQQNPLSGPYRQRYEVWLRRRGCHRPQQSLDRQLCIYRTASYNRGGNSQYPGVPTICDHARICKGAIVFGGIRVGQNAVVGANAVVNKPVADNAVVAGVPAKLLHYREPAGK